MMTTATQQRYITVAELAKLTGLCTRTLQTLYRDQGMPHVRVGRAVRFDPVRVAAWLEKRYGQGDDAQ